MTHTLHRQIYAGDLTGDFVILSMAAQGFNDRGAAARLASLLKILSRHQPVNYGDDSIGGIYTGVSKEEMVANASDYSYMDAVYGSIDDLKRVLKELKEADLGISVTVTGDREIVLAALEEVGLKPNAIHLSLGIMGRKERLPEKEVLEICSMCGHGMIAPARVRETAVRIKRGKLTAAEGARLLGGTCTCGIFNVEKAAEILEKMAREEG